MTDDNVTPIRPASPLVHGDDDRVVVDVSLGPDLPDFPRGRKPDEVWAAAVASLEAAIARAAAAYPWANADEQVGLIAEATYNLLDRELGGHLGVISTMINIATFHPASSPTPPEAA